MGDTCRESGQGPGEPHTGTYGCHCVIRIESPTCPLLSSVVVTPGPEAA